MSISLEFYNQLDYHSRVAIKQTHLGVQGCSQFCDPYILPGRKDSKMYSSNENEFMKEEVMNKTKSGR